MDDESREYDAEQTSDGSDDPDALAGDISDAACAAGRRLAVVESLTGGLISSDLAASSGSSEWFRGGVVAYDRVTKHGVLGVPDGPVVCEPAVRAMAESASTMFDADLVIAVSGAGGPDPQDDQPPGTVWMALADHGDTTTWVCSFPGEPGEVLRRVRHEALLALRGRLTRA